MSYGNRKSRDFKGGPVYDFSGKKFPPVRHKFPHLFV
jgi:hypothetical protein